MINIGGTNYNIAQWPVPKTVPAIKWAQKADGYWLGRDRGSSEDAYFGTVRFVDREENITSLQTTLFNNQSGITLSGFNGSEMLFGANVSYSGSINCAVTNISQRRNVTQNKIYEIEVTFRAISPTLLSVTPSLSGLNLQDGFTTQNMLGVNSKFTYSQAATYIDRSDRTLKFTGEFLQSNEEMKQIRAALLSTVRDNAITFPVQRLNVLPGFNPFGPCAGPWKVKILDFRETRKSLDKWILELDMVKDVPVFSAGSASRNLNNITYLQAGRGSRNLANFRLGQRNY